MFLLVFYIAFKSIKLTGLHQVNSHIIYLFFVLDKKNINNVYTFVFTSIKIFFKSVVT
jgi:hypothetical protein